MKLLLVTFAFITTLLGSDIDWNHDYELALSTAKKENKDVYMLITSADCKWCRKFEFSTLQDEKTIARLKKQYVLLHIDRDWDDIPEHFEKQRVPRHYFLNCKGETIYTFLGYWDAEDFGSFLFDIDKRKKINYEIRTNR